MQQLRHQWPRLIGTALALVLCVSAHAAISVRILGETAEISPAPQVDDGVLMGAPASIVGRLGCRFMSGDGDSLLIVTPDGRRVTVTPGHDTLIIDERTVRLPRKAFVAGGRVIAPLRPVLEAIGARPHWDPQRRVLDIVVPLQEITVHADDEGARVRLQTPLRSRGTLSRIDNPERYYVDLPGVWVDLQHKQTYVNRGNLLRVRWGQFKEKPPTARVVLDLREGAKVRWEADEEGRGGSLLIDSFDGEKPLIERRLPMITRLVMRAPDKDTTIVRVELTDPLEVQYDVQRRPPRVVLEFPDAAPAAPMRPVEGDSPFVRMATLEGVPGTAGSTLTLQMHQLIHFEVDSTDDPPAVNVVFRRGLLSDRRIVIDPGHGGRDPGARGKRLLEKEVNLDVGRQVAARLMALGAQATLTRETDVFVDLYDRPRLANRLGADLFVSIHCNAMPRPNTGRGTETYYWNAYSKCLGLIMQSELVRTLGRRDNGLRRRNFVVVRETEMPGVLVELMYLNCDEEEALLSKPEVRAAAADAIVEGLRQYIEGTGTAADRSRLGM